MHLLLQLLAHGTAKVEYAGGHPPSGGMLEDMAILLNQMFNAESAEFAEGIPKP